MRRIALVLTVVIIISVLIPYGVGARSWDVPSEIPSIQAAIDSAVTGDTVAVMPGTYSERLTIADKSITLLGVGGPDHTVLSGASLPVNGLPILAVVNADSTGRVTGFTFQDGDAVASDGFGGAISCRDTCYVVIENNVFRNNSALYGGAIAVSTYPGSGKPTIKSNTFLSNMAFISGGGISIDWVSSGVITENVFVGNVAGSGGGQLGRGGAISFNALFDTTETLVIRNNILYQNEAEIGGAMRVWDGTVTITGNTIVSNRLNGGGTSRAAGIDLITIIPALVSNNIIAFNQNGWGLAVYDEPPILECNDFWSNELGDYHSVSPGATDFSADPQFCSFNSPSGLTLSSGSPCLPENSGGCGLVGAFGLGCSGTVGIEPGEGVASAVVLRVPHPNPSSSATHIAYFLPEPQHVTLTIHDLRGGIVANLVDEEESPGDHALSWIDHQLASGVYFVRLKAGGVVRTQRLLLIR